MTIGTDPEFFVKKVDGKFVNAEHYFPGTKAEPHMMACGAGLQTDNVAVEFASPVAENGEDLVDKLKATFKELFKIMPEDLVLDLTPSVEFPEEELQTEQAQLFGCSPSYDAWELTINEQPNAENTRMRSIGGHIHVGHSEGDGNDFLLEPFGKIAVVKTMDAVHGIISVMLDNSEAAVERRKLYGKAGEHRPTLYGVEYRTLSAFWLKSPSLVMLISTLTEDVLRLVREEKHTDLIEAIQADNIRYIIDTGDVEKAKKVYEEILKDYISDEAIELFEMCQNTDFDFHKEWK